MKEKDEVMHAVRPLTRKQLAESWVRITVPGRKRAVRFPVAVRHSMREAPCGFCAPFNENAPIAPVHRFSITMSECSIIDAHDLRGPARGAGLAAAFAVAIKQPGIVVASDPDDRTRGARMVEIGYLELREFTGAQCRESGGDWFWYLDPFGDDMAEVGGVIAQIINVDHLATEIGYHRPIDRVYYLDAVEIHPFFRGGALGARLAAHAMTRLTESSGTLFFAHITRIAEVYRTLSSANEEPAVPAPDRRWTPEQYTAIARYFERIHLSPVRWHGLGTDPRLLTLGGGTHQPYGELVWALGFDYCDEARLEDELAREDQMEEDATCEVDPEHVAAVMGLPVGSPLEFDHLNPIHVGIGPYPASISLEQYTGIIESLIKPVGIDLIFGTMHDMLKQTFGSAGITRRDAWVHESVAEVEQVGLTAFLSRLVTRLRVRYADAPRR